MPSSRHCRRKDDARARGERAPRPRTTARARQPRPRTSPRGTRRGRRAPREVIGAKTVLLDCARLSPSATTAFGSAFAGRRRIRLPALPRCRFTICQCSPRRCNTPERPPRGEAPEDGPERGAAQRRRPGLRVEYTIVPGSTSLRRCQSASGVL
ncbi:hypothetical protein M885DRAFT_513798 [Pelagophyceae sp. CCMP2097]|nr:hypothetical protein M885DRAFT_513798 [Pelagophyceae sp. CCMP2097]